MNFRQKEAEVAEKKLDAEIRLKAEADKYAEMQNADAELYRPSQKDAEAQHYEAQKEAAAHPCKRSRLRQKPSGKKVWLGSRSSGQKGRSYEKMGTGSDSGNDRRSSSGYCKKCGRTITLRLIKSR